MLNRSTPIVETALRGLHPRSIDDAREIRSLLERAHSSRSVFHRGLNRSVDLETAIVESIDDDEIVLRAPSFENPVEGQVFLNFTCDSRPFFFATTRSRRASGGRLVVRMPPTIYYSERRDRTRRAPDRAAGDPSRLEVERGDDKLVEATVEDVSPGGLGILVRGDTEAREGGPLRVRFLDGREAGTEVRLELRNRQPAAGRAGWTRIGLVRDDPAAVQPIEVEHRRSIAERRTGAEASVAEVSADSGQRPEGPARADTSADVCRKLAEAAPEVVLIENARGEEIVGLLDSWGERRGAPVVIMPNGWGRTKEALLPLARTIVATFRAQGEPISVLRFDGIRKRGESYKDPECRVPGRETQGFVFSQGVEDIETLAHHVRSAPELQASSVVVVSFSAAAIEVRKALARARRGLIDGWVSVVGSPDLQSMARSISGGVDFVGGSDRGHRFGLQELLGVVVDIDRIAEDARRNEMSFIEEARRDLAGIDVPITWFHGEYDAWVDLRRVRDVLSHGDTSRRRLIVIPTGHQLKSSREAAETFECIAREVGRMTLGRDLETTAADRDEVRRLRLAERRRLPREEPDLRGFWRDYLIGRDSTLGIELLTASSAYRSMMDLQIRLLQLQPGMSVADLGSGTGSFELQLARAPGRPRGLSIRAFDYVREALARARSRLELETKEGDLSVSFLAADLDVTHARQRIPVESGSVDRVIASLLLSYLECPELVLAEIWRILRPGGRLVVSSLRSDADFSRLYVQSFVEHQMGATREQLPEFEETRLSAMSRSFLNDAARILDLEESGAFRFWDTPELVELVSKAGFGQVDTRSALGVPPQAVVVAAVKPGG